MNEKLKPCPFCGDIGMVCATPWDFDKKKKKEIYRYIVECAECLAQTDAYKTREEATEAWNRRAGK